MQYAYLFAGALMLSVWIFLFVRRKDLRKEMLTMSILACPLLLADFFFVPVYWQPITLFGIPFGIEGLIYTFCLGGITAVLYSEVSHRTPHHIHAWHKKGAVIILALTLVVFLSLLAMNASNPMIALYVALLLGLALMLYVRKDLIRGTLIGGICFGLLYFVVIKLWLFTFPEAGEWFFFNGIPEARVFGVPLWELLFGVIFAAYWGNVYQILFGYKLVKTPHKKTPAKRP